MNDLFQEFVSWMQDTLILNQPVIEIVQVVVFLLFIIFGIKILNVAFLHFLKKSSFLKKIKQENNCISINSITVPFKLVLIISGVAVVSKKFNIWQNFVPRIFCGFSIFLLFWFFAELSKIFVTYIKLSIRTTKYSALTDFLPLLQKVIWYVMIFLGILCAADNLGYSISAILATFGLGGAAFAFAAKDTLANLWGSLSIVMDKPFKIGDWVDVGNKFSGSIESIGIRSTKIRTDSQTLLSVPNNTIANEWINNWSEKSNIHIKQTVLLQTDTNTQKIKEFLQNLRISLAEMPFVQKNSVIVRLTGFNSISMQIVINYELIAENYAQELSCREEISLKILSSIKENNLCLAPINISANVKDNIG